MNQDELRDQLQTIDRILQASDQRLHIGAELYIVWGVVSALIDVFAQLVLDGRLATVWLLIPAAGILAGIVISILRSIAYRHRSERMTFIQREYLNVLWLAFSLAAVASYVARNLFTGWGSAAVWTLVAAFVTFYIGLHNNRNAQIAGIVLVVSLIVANFTPGYVGYVLGAGMLVGYAGFGVSSLLARE